MFNDLLQKSVVGWHNLVWNKFVFQSSPSKSVWTTTWSQGDEQ